MTFRHAFRLASCHRELPAGTYRLVTDEEEVLGLSFLAFRRTATMLHAPAIAARSGTGEVFLIDPRELAAALTADTPAGPQAEGKV